MVPDLATLRDRATTKFKAMAYGIFALGWRGSMRHWHRYERAYLLLAALATPLVLSPGLVLHGAEGGYSAEAEAILRGGPLVI